MRSFLCTVVLLLGSSFAYTTPTRNISRKQFLIRSAASASLLQGLFSPLPASALPAPEKQKETEVRKGQGENGAIGAAFKIQNEETNARLAKAGISLGSDKEQDQRLSDALSSFSYDSSVSKARGKK
ncbi:hypothetical protein TrVE_jg8851 [Triparma verrucosa]|uniref:Uncharacterized protein n=1 Tax=Triparma verrucosa TaxID=1606542 RepID=A0A9W7KXX9_9STRA|nr:hypothetical protein TrVE_jg8851 [Triparma verrucosa]